MKPVAPAASRKQIQPRRPLPTLNVTAQVARPVDAPPPDPQNVVNEEMAKLDDSIFIFRCPKEMTVDATETVTFTVQDSLDSVLQRQLRSRGLNIEHVATSMEATLSPDRPGIFDIVAEQGSPGTGWKWRVTPKEPGLHTMNLNVRFMATLTNEPHERIFPPLSRAVVVKTNAIDALTEMFGGPLLWIAPLGLLALLLAWVRHRSRVAA
jgi:hypothetical protein